MLRKLVNAQDLSFEEAYNLFFHLLEEEDTRIAAYLASMQTKGYNSEEIAGMAKAMRDASIKIDMGTVADTAGTGGDGFATINVSTASAIILSLFTRVAKHGNTSITSRSGSADVLNALGMNIYLSPEKARNMINATNFTFIFAPHYHPALKKIMPVRKILQIPTIFNILGPLANPAEPAYQVVGVNSPSLVEKIGSALSLLGIKKGIVLHGSGLDEVHPSKETMVYEVHGNRTDTYILRIEDFGLRETKLRVCSSPQESALRIKSVLAGDGKEEDRVFILANAATALYAANIADDFREGVEMVKNVLGTEAQRKLEEIVWASTN